MRKINYFFLILLFLGITISANAQTCTKIGEDIDGEAAGDQSGYSVSLSSDGSIVAIGAPYNDGNGSDAGHVRIYQNVAGTWTQIGSDIDGEAISDGSGNPVSLNSDGSVVAIGAIYNDGNGTEAGHVRIFQNIAGTWTQVGTDINGEAAGDLSGYSVSLSSDGSVVAIGAIYNDGNGLDAGQVRIYQNIAGTWIQIGIDIDGEVANDLSGYSLSLNSDGSVIAIGAPQNGGNGSDAGHVRIYQNVAGTWTQIGVDIDGEAVEDYSGVSVSLSSDSLVVAIGAHYNDGNGTSSGHVRIYQNIAGTWTQIGSDINGETAGDFSGYSISLSSDGSFIAIGASGNTGNGTDAGHVRIYQNTAGTWTQIGADIDGEAAGDLSGYSVSLNSDGSVVAIGAIYNDGNGSDAGHVKVYNLLIPPTITSQPANQTNICPGAEVDFSIEGENINTYLWQISTNGGGAWSDLSDDATYTGTANDTLTVITDISLNNYQYRCYLTNDGGNTTSDDATLTFDIENPVITSIHNDHTVDADENCEALLAAYTGDVTATDNCDVDLTVTQLPVSGTIVSGTTNQVTLTVTDDLGNETEVSFNVTVEDNTNPIISSTHNDQIVDADANCEASLLDYTGDVIATDNCDIDLTVTQSPVSGTIVSGTTNQVTLIIADDAGNEAEVTFNVKVTDNINPTVTCVSNQEADADATNTYTVSGIEFDPTNTDDNCEVSSVTNDFTGTATLAGTSLPVGTTTIVWTVIDAAGNNAECSFDVLINTYVGIKELEEIGISIYPNPTNGIIEFDFAENNIQKIKITDITGRVVIEKITIQQNETIDLSGFDSGIYIVILETGKGSFTAKIIKE